MQFKHVLLDFPVYWFTKIAKKVLVETVYYHDNTQLISAVLIDSS